MMSRRSLGMFFGAGGAVAALAACTPGGPGSTASTATSAVTESATASAAATSASTTAGPYPGDGSNGPNVPEESGVVRQDITSSFGSGSAKSEGVP